MGHSAAATAPAIAALIALTHDTLSPSALRRLTDIHHRMMRCGYIKDTMPREETSARRTRYGTASEANCFPIGGR